MTRFAFEIPEIETDHLILRAPQESDLDPLADFFASDRSLMVGGPLNRAQSWRIISGSLGHWLLRGFGMWHIHHKGDDRMIGATGFLHGEGWEEPELGWNLQDGYEGAGYAYEAANAARSLGAAKLGLNGVISYIAPENHRSRALALRMGAVLERDGTLFDKPVQVFRHPKIEKGL